MRVLWSIALTACVSLLLGTGVGLTADDTDKIEFVKVADAQWFGFAALPGAVLTTATPGRIGDHALRIDPGPQPREYMGIGLRREFDLTRAGAGDKLVFFVKQNFGNDLCINVTTARGNVYRYAQVTPEQWSRVELDLDLANWQHDKARPVSAWTGVDYLQVYSRGFDQVGEYMLMDGFSISVDGKAARTLLEKWEFPWQTESAWYVGNAKVAWAISNTTGQVLGGWNAKTRERYLNYLEGRYHLEDRKSLVTACESADKVIRAEFIQKEQRIELTCANPAVPDLTIKKRYWISGNKLFQRVAFRTTSNDLQFITCNSQASFASAYRDGGYYMGGADGGGPLVPAPHLTEWQKVTQYQNTAKNMLLHQPEKGYSFAHTRTKIDDQFVWPYFTGAVASYVEAVNMMSYTPDGWDMSLGTSKLSTQRETSFEQYVSIFEGDWQRHIRNEYPALPEVQQALKEIPPVPDWVGDIKIECDANMDRLRRMVGMTDEGTIMVLFNLSGSWADYYVDRGMEGGFGGWITGPELRDHIHRIKALSPRIKVGIYMWTLSTCAHSRIYRAHPEWFRYGNKDGEPLSTFPGLAPNFAQLLSIPECYKEILSQFDLVLSYLGTDFIYLDDPKAINMIEWKSGEYTRDDLCFRFFLDLKRLVARHGPDKMVFFNNQCNPYGDVNFIEARDQLRANYWRRFAGIAAVDQEFVTSTRPQARINLLYFIPPLRREYMNRILALGWIPSLEYCDVIASRPFFQAAYEVGNCAPVPARYSPDWKRDKETNLESYTVQRDGDKGYLLSFINHAETKESVPIHLDLDSLNLERGGRVFVWQYMVENALEYEGSVTESLARQVYAQTRWQLDRVTRRRLLHAGPYQKNLELRLDMEPLILHQLYVTTQPAAVYSENYLPANYLFNGMPKVKLNAKADWKKGTIEVQVDSSRDQAEIVVFLPQSSYRLQSATLDGRPAEPDWVWEGEVQGDSSSAHRMEMSLRVSSPTGGGELAKQSPPVSATPRGIASTPPSGRSLAMTIENAIWEGNHIFPVVKVGKGRHTLSLKFESGAEPTPARVEGFRIAKSEAGVSVNLPGYERALLTVEKNNRMLFSRMVARNSGLLNLSLSPARSESGAYTVSLRAVVAGNGRVHPVKDVSASLDLPAAKPDLGLGPEYTPAQPGQREIKAVNSTIRGLEILSSAILTTSETPNEIQPGLKMLTAKVQPDDLILEAGTTRAILQGQDGLLGAAFAGLEVKNLRRVRVKLTNTFYNAFHLRGPGFHVPERPNSRNFAGIVVDYHTPAGYTQRVRLATGVLHRECSSTYPDWGRAALADESRDLGLALIEAPEKTFALDLQQYAPPDWDGQVWLSVGSDWVCANRRLGLQILAVNDAVTGDFLSGTDPRAFRAAYEKPRSLTVPRSPGGIIVDGLPFEEWWKEAVRTEDFFLLGGEGVSKARTTAMLMYDDVNLYVAFLCAEPDRRKPLIIGGPPWDDDEVEVWIDADGDQKTFRQVILNAANGKMEYWESGPGPIGATTAVHIVEGDSWMVEMAIPFAGLGVPPPKPGNAWRLSLCRYRPSGKGFSSEAIVWAPLGAGGFKDLANFGKLVFR